MMALDLAKVTLNYVLLQTLYAF